MKKAQIKTLGRTEILLLDNGGVIIKWNDNESAMFSMTEVQDLECTLVDLHELAVDEGRFEE